MSFNGPVFVVGCARSGTKLIRDLMNRHPRIRIPKSETELLPYLASIIDSFGDLSQPMAFSHLCDWAMDSLYFRSERHTRDPAAYEERWRSWCRSYDLPGIFEGLIRADVDAAWDSDIIWGDKSPGYVVRLDLLHELYPERRVVHIVRDVRDVCLSSRKAWGKSMRRNAQRWVYSMELSRRQSAVLGDRYLEIRYEDLLTDTEATMRRVAAHLDIEFVPEMLWLEESTETLGSAKGSLEVMASAAQRWKTQMTSGDQQRVEAIAWSTLQAHGHEVSAPPPEVHELGNVQMKLLKAYDGVQLAARRVRVWGAKDLVRLNWRLWRMQQTARV